MAGAAANDLVNLLYGFDVASGLADTHGSLLIVVQFLFLELQFVAAHPMHTVRLRALLHVLRRVQALPARLYGLARVPGFQLGAQRLHHLALLVKACERRLRIKVDLRSLVPPDACLYALVARLANVLDEFELLCRLPEQRVSVLCLRIQFLHCDRVEWGPRATLILAEQSRIQLGVRGLSL